MSHSPTTPWNPRLTVLALSGCFFLTGCAVTPKPYTQAELTQINQADRTALRTGVPDIVQAVSLEEAIARALKYNLRLPDPYQ